jgi:YjbR
VTARVASTLQNMVSAAEFRQIALQFLQTEESTHHAIRQFTIKKKIFVTLNEPENRACFKFSEADQYAFSAFKDSPFYPVPNKWAKFGWTNVNLARADLDMISEAITAAFVHCCPKSPTWDKYRSVSDRL